MNVWDDAEGSGEKGRLHFDLFVATRDGSAAPYTGLTCHGIMDHHHATSS